MNLTETAQLLALAAAYDRRTVGQADVRAWHEVLGDISFTDGAAAVKDHYAASREFIMPANIRTAVRLKRERRLADNPDFVPDADPDDVHAWLAALREGRVRRAGGDRTLPPGARDTFRHTRALTPPEETR